MGENGRGRGDVFFGLERSRSKATCNIVVGIVWNYFLGELYFAMLYALSFVVDVSVLFSGTVGLYIRAEKFDLQ